MITHCCYGAYADIGHSDDCPRRVPPKEKPHLDLLKEGPARGLWRCQAPKSHVFHRGACLGRTPAEAYCAWKSWQDHVKTRPFAFLGVGA